MGEQEYDIIWKEGGLFEKGHFKIIPKKPDNGAELFGWLIAAVIIVVVVSLLILTLPIWTALIGLKMVREKRYYAGIFVVASYLYFWLDIQNGWLSSYMFLGYFDDENILKEGLLNLKYLKIITILNSIALVIGLGYILDSILISKFGKKNNDGTVTGYQILAYILPVFIVLPFYLMTDFEKKPTLIDEVEETVNYETITNSNNVIDDEVEVSNFDFFSEILSAFNSKRTDIINKYINPNYGLMNFRYEGYHSFLNFDKTINNFLSLAVGDDILFENLEEGELPNYIGDGEFKSTGSFYSDYSNQFKLDNFIDAYNWEEDFIEPYRELEKLCNYRIQSISKCGTRIYSFYLSINNNEKYLVGITYESVPDALFITSNKNYIDIENEENIRKYLDQNIFCDDENNVSINFSDFELDFYGGEPQKIIEYTIGTLQEVSKKIKTIAIELTFKTSDDYSEILYLHLTNKGDIHIYPSGASSGYLFKKCNINS